MKSVSVFHYSVEESRFTVQEAAKMMESELNKGVLFYITEGEAKEVIPRTSGRKWVSCHAEDNKIIIYVDDEFFIQDVIFNQILTCLLMNLLDFAHIRMEDFSLSRSLHKQLVVENKVRDDVNALLGNRGPYLGLILKPQYSLSLSEKVKIARRFARLGGTFVKEDETYFTAKSKLIEEAKTIQHAINEVSDSCFYVPNVTGHAYDGEFLSKLIKYSGVRCFLLNFLIAGLPRIKIIRKKARKALLWGHRVGYKALENYISMKALAKLAVYSGLDILHIGTPLRFTVDEVKERREIIKEARRIRSGFLPVFTKITIDISRELIRHFGKRIILMACGGFFNGNSFIWDEIEQWIEVTKSA